MFLPLSDHSYSSLSSICVVSVMVMRSADLAIYEKLEPQLQPIVKYASYLASEIVTPWSTTAFELAFPQGLIGAALREFKSAKFDDKGLDVAFQTLCDQEFFLKVDKEVTNYNLHMTHMRKLDLASEHCYVFVSKLTRNEVRKLLTLEDKQKLQGVLNSQYQLMKLESTMRLQKIWRGFKTRRMIGNILRDTKEKRMTQKAKEEKEERRSLMRVELFREILPSLPEAVDFHCNTAKAVKEGKTLVKRNTGRKLPPVPKSS